MLETGHSFAGTERYTPVRLLGAGGMGAVYEVKDVLTGQRLALKVMLDHHNTARRLLRFKQEFRAVAELSHPNLVRLLELVCEEGRWFFTMELIEGEGLLDALWSEAPRDGETLSTSLETLEGLNGSATALMETQPIPLREPACDLATLTAALGQVLDALEYLHQRGIVHRDLKPSNIILGLDGVVRLLDFGLVSVIHRSVATSPDGTFMGTLAYTSPEQCRGATATPASDLYALGCVLFQLITGDLPFAGAPEQVIHARMTQPPPRIGRRVKGVPPELAAICERLMATSPDDRPSIDAIRDALDLAPQATSARDAPSLEGVFVGRGEELERLEGCLSRAFDGQLQLALISGPSGMGKSTLASRVAATAKQQGFLAFKGRCYEHEQVPFVAFDRAMDAMILTLATWPEERLAPAREAMEESLPIFPAIGALLKAASSRADAPERAPAPQAQSLRAFHGFCRLIEHCQRHAPLLFVLDDIQWADHESVALLEALLECEGRVMILGLYRPEGVDAEHPLGRLLRRAELRDDVTTMRLPRLEEPDIAQLIAAVSGKSTDTPSSASLTERAGGNPFMATQLARLLTRMTPSERSAALDGDGDISEKLLRHRFDAITDKAQGLLSKAAATGSDFPTELLRGVSGLEGPAFDAALHELISQRLLKRLPARSRPERASRSGEVGSGRHEHARLDLYHDRIRAAAYALLTPEARRQTHLALATAIEAMPAAQRDHQAEALLHHWSVVGDDAQRIRFALEAAEQAAAKLAFERAARLLRSVLTSPGHDAPCAVRAAQWERVGDLYQHCGRSREAAEAYQQAHALWGQPPLRDDTNQRNARLRLYGNLAYNLISCGDVHQGWSHCARGLELIGLSSDRSFVPQLVVLMWLRLRLALAATLPVSWVRREVTAQLLAQFQFLEVITRVSWAVRPLLSAEATMRSALIGTQVDDKRTLQHAIAFRTITRLMHTEHLDPETQRRLHQDLDEAEALALNHKLPIGLEIVQVGRAQLWSFSDTGRARSTLSSAIEGMKLKGMLFTHEGFIARSFLASFLAMYGDEQEALEFIERELNSPFSNALHETFNLYFKVELLVFLGLLERAEEAQERFEALTADMPACLPVATAYTARVALLTAQGRFEEALADHTDQERSFRTHQLHILRSFWGRWLRWNLEASLGLARQGKLTPNGYRHARRWAKRLTRMGPHCPSSLGPRGQALLAHSQGRRREATEAIERALSASVHHTSPYDRWLCLEAARELGVLNSDGQEEARMLQQRGRYQAPSSEV